MRSAAIALAVSLAVHAALALAFGACLVSLPGSSGTSAVLDLGSVELSFAEEDAPEAAPSQSAVSAAEAAPSPPPAPAAEPPPAVAQALSPVAPPAVEAVRLDEPVRPSPEMSAPTVVAPAVAPRQARVDAPPRPRREIRPDYPRGARQRGEQGDVTVELTVDAAGAVAAVRVVAPSGFSELDEAAVRAVRAARFTPARSDGAAVSSTARLTLNFRLK